MYQPSRTNRRRSIRLQGYDYSRGGLYFVTVCSYRHQRLFGTADRQDVLLSEVGRIVEQEWLRTPHIRPQVELDEFVVMPDHFHGLIMVVERTIVATPAPEPRDSPPAGRLQSPTQTIGAIIRGWKAAVTKRVRELRGGDIGPIWQRGYWDHIVRNEQDLHDIRQYIIENPRTWGRSRGDGCARHR